MEAIAAPQVCYRHCYTPFPVSWVRQKVVPLPARVSLLRGIYLLTKVCPDLQAIAVQRCLYHGLTRLTDRSTLFSCLVVRRRRMTSTPKRAPCVYQESSANSEVQAEN